MYLQKKSSSKQTQKDPQILSVQCWMISLVELAPYSQKHGGICSVPTEKYHLGHKTVLKVKSCSFNKLNVRAHYEEI